MVPGLGGVMLRQDKAGVPQRIFFIRRGGIQFLDKLLQGRGNLEATGNKDFFPC